MDNVIIFSVLFIVALFFVSFFVVYKYASWTTKKEKTIISYGKVIVDSINPSNNSKPLQSFVKFMNTSNPKPYSLKGNKYE